MHQVDPARRKYRYYRMVMQRDLFGGASLIREWGYIGQPGRVKTLHLVTPAAVSAQGKSVQGEASNAIRPREMSNMSWLYLKGISTGDF